MPADVRQFHEPVLCMLYEQALLLLAAVLVALVLLTYVIAFCQPEHTGDV